MSELIFIVEEAPEGGYMARALGESIFTEAESIPALHEQVRDAVRCHFVGNRLPKSITLEVCVAMEEKRQETTELRRAISEYAIACAGTADDLDEDWEEVGIKMVLGLN